MSETTTNESTTSEMTASEFQNWNRGVIAEFRANGGKVGGDMDGWPLLILTTTGVKSGQPRESPLVYTTDGENLVVIASKGGAPAHPDWFRNVVANPEVTVEVGTDKYQAQAVVPEGAERDRLFDAQAAIMPNFREYQNKTSRTIPVVVLERVDR